MTTTTDQLDLVRQQRDHAEAELHRLRQTINTDLLAALTLTAAVLDAWQHHTLQAEVRNVAPELATTLDALQASPDDSGTTCLDCGKAINDETPTAANADGELLHVGCGEPCVCHTAFTCLAHDHDEAGHP
jgi:hypothetical protein